MDLNKLAKEIHENAKKHGWWGEERPFAEIISLIHSELSEALEEYRNGREVDEIYYSCGADHPAFNAYCPKCKHQKPEGIPFELADVMIRIMDYLAKEKVEINSRRDYLKTCGYPEKLKNPFPQAIAQLHVEISMAYLSEMGGAIEMTKALVSDRLIWILCLIEKYCTENSINIKEAISEKMRFNKFRPYRHGGKKI